MDEEKSAAAGVAAAGAYPAGRGGGDVVPVAELRAQMGGAFSKLEKMFAENRAEAAKRIAELNIWLAAVNRGVVDDKELNKVMYSENAYYRALWSRREFAGIRFDDVCDIFKGIAPLPDGTTLHDMFDIVMLNDTDVALIETGYIKLGDAKKLAEERVKNFRTIFSYYKDFKIYLGLADASFEDGVFEEARKYGVGLLKLVDETIEQASDWDVKAY